MEKEYLHFKVKPCTSSIGAEIEEINLSNKLPQAAYAELKHALAQFKVIFFRDQQLTDEEFHNFGNGFGQLEIHEFFPTKEEFPEIQVIQTQGGNTGTDRWHTDVTFRKAPSAASILRAIDIPPNAGGDTMWLCTNCAFKGLSKPMQNMLLELNAVHDMRMGMTGYVDGDKIEETAPLNPPMIHPAVIEHPRTGAPHLFVNSIWTRCFENLEREESDVLLNFLFNHVKRPEFQVRFKWARNSIAIWDNIATQHYAVGDYAYPRTMNRMIVDGTQLHGYGR